MGRFILLTHRGDLICEESSIEDLSASARQELLDDPSVKLEVWKYVGDFEVTLVKFVPKGEDG